MTWGTHISLPVIVAGAHNLRAFAKRNEFPLERKHFALIALCAVLPDVLSPHIGIAARQASWTHSAWVALGGLAACLLAAWKAPRGWRTALWFSLLALSLHIFCDAISGGVTLFIPFGDVVGDYYVSPEYWLPLDLVTMIAAYLIWWRCRQQLKRARREGEAETPV